MVYVGKDKHYFYSHSACKHILAEIHLNWSVKNIFGQENKKIPASPNRT